MATKATVFLLSLSLLIALSEQQGFDYFQFVYEWQPAMCNSGEDCKQPISDRFSIHGLWPSDYSSGQLPPCKGSAFDPKKVKALRPRLLQNWPDVVNGEPEAQWAHKWSAHGTCSESSFDEFQYFSIALDTYGQYGMLAYLEKGGIRPYGWKTFTKEDIDAAIRPFTKTKPAVRCSDLKRGPPGRKQLQKITLCLSKDGSTLIDCPDKISYTCPKEFVWIGKPLK